MTAFKNINFPIITYKYSPLKSVVNSSKTCKLKSITRNFVSVLIINLWHFPGKLTIKIFYIRLAYVLIFCERILYTLRNQISSELCILSCKYKKIPIFRIDHGRYKWEYQWTEYHEETHFTRNSSLANGTQYYSDNVNDN